VLTNRKPRFKQNSKDSIKNILKRKLVGSQMQKTVTKTAGKVRGKKMQTALERGYQDHNERKIKRMKNKRHPEKVRQTKQERGRPAPRKETSLERRYSKHTEAKGMGENNPRIQANDWIKQKTLRNSFTPSRRKFNM
jgi:hypothetical protein